MHYLCLAEICHHLLHFKRMCEAGQYTEVETELNKLPQKQDWLRPDIKIELAQNPDDDDSLSEEEDLSSENDKTEYNNMDVDELLEEKSVTNNDTSNRNAPEIVEEPGWTTVCSSRKKR